MRRRYIPDIVKQMADCEANYVRLMRLLPDFDNCDEREFEIHWQGQNSAVRLQVEERFTYTTTVRVSHLLEHDWLKAPVCWSECTMMPVQRKLSVLYGVSNCAVCISIRIWICDILMKKHS